MCSGFIWRTNGGRLLSPNRSSVQGRTSGVLAFAALYYIQRAGSSRNTANGWTSWRTEDVQFIADLRSEQHFVAAGTNGIDATRGPWLLSGPMRSTHSKLLLTCLAAILFVAVMGQAVAQHAEGVLEICASEHQDAGQDAGSHCPCVCHHHQTAVAGWQVSMPHPLAVVSDVVEEPQSISEAPPVSIEYPPRLA